MIREQTASGSGIIARWSESLDELHGRIGRRFARVEVRERVRCYLVSTQMR